MTPQSRMPRPSRTAAAASLAVAAFLAVAVPTAAWAQDGADAGDAAAEAVTKKSYFQMFFRSDDIIGQLIIVLLVVMSFISISLTIYFALQARRATMIPQTTVDELNALMAEKKYRDAIEFAETDESFVGKLAYASLNEASHGYGAMERALEEAGDIETTRKLRPIEYLNVLGNVSPMIGLFGTVYGMILAFQSLVEAAGRPNPVELAGGISTALVTTLWGLIVAIPAIAAYTVIRNQIDALSAESMLVAEELIQPFKRKKKTAIDTGSSGDRPSRPKATPRPE